MQVREGGVNQLQQLEPSRGEDSGLTMRKNEPESSEGTKKHNDYLILVTKKTFTSWNIVTQYLKVIE